MSWIATAIVGSAIVGAVVSDRASSRAGDATRDATSMQLAEIRRQWDYQQQVLQPFLEQQLGASQAYGSLLGVQPASISSAQGGGQGEWGGAGNTFTHQGPGAGRAPQGSQYQTQPSGMVTHQGPGTGLAPRPSGSSFQAQYGSQPAAGQPTGRTFDASRRPGGGNSFFVDPNVDPTRTADAVGGSRLAPGVGGRSIAEGAAGTGVYGEDFEASEGYNFMVEEAGRANERLNSAGGNYGGRALMESNRRAKGLSATEYYNWASGRERDLGRRGSAEAADIYRMDQAQQGDATRMDRSRQFDLSRSDANYQNYLANLARMSGFGNTAAQVAGLSGQAGANVGNAYANQGNTLAQLEYARGAGLNNAIQGGVQNYLTYQASQ